MTAKNPTRDLVTDLFRRFAGQVNNLTIPRPYIDLCGGDHLGALLLSQILYWSDRTNDANGWFAKSYEEWHEELAMTEYQVKRAINGDKRNKHTQKALKDFGVETKLKPSNFHNGAATLHYRVNIAKLQEAVIDFVQNAVLNNVQNAPPTLSKTPPQQSSELYTETTSEPISETIPNKPSKKNRVTQKDCDALIDVWASILKLNADVMGTDYHTTSARRHAKEMLLWTRPPTRQEFELVIKESGKDFIPFEFLSGAIIKLRAKKPAVINPAHVPFATTSPEGEPYVSRPDEARAALQSLTKSVHVNDEVIHAELAKSA